MRSNVGNLGHGICRHFIAPICLFLVATVPDILSLSAAESHWQIYADKVYEVTLRFPEEWKKTPSYDVPHFEGQDGFVHLDASDANNPKQACQLSAEHHLQPYGTHPIIRSMKIDGQNACLVWPSKVQRPGAITRQRASARSRTRCGISASGGDRRQSLQAIRAGR